MKRYRRAVVTVVLIIAIVTLHAWLLHYMADRQIVARLLSPNHKDGVAPLLSAALFIGLRLIVLVALPPLVTARLCVFALDRWHRRRTSGSTPS